MIGFLGTNGAGKSTALKLIAGISQPTSGSVRVRGRIASLVELGVGFHPDLTGMENIFYGGAIMGLRRGEILERLEAIIDFSGMRKFLHEPVKHYSSGMYARLACSVALHLDPDIILIDEILAVGDAEFQQQGMRRIIELHDRGITIALVSHAIVAARDMCDRLIWLDHGTIRADGPPREVVSEYLHHIHRLALPTSHFLHHERPVVHGPDTLAGIGGEEPWTRENAPRLASVRIESPNGERLDDVETGSPVRFVFCVESGGTIPVPFVLSLCVRWPDGHELFRDTTPPIQPAESGVPIVYEVPAWPYLRGDMLLSAALLPASGGGGLVLDRAENVIAFRTKTAPAHYIEHAVLAPPTVWSVETRD
jgi:ABC-type polysaccharide/polyol phosphate transport system ATPase subunit